MRIKITTTRQQYRARLLFTLKQEVSKRFTQRKSRILHLVRGVVRQALQESSTVQSLLSGPLKIDFGFTDEYGQTVILDMINYIVRRVEVTLEFKGDNAFAFNLKVLPGEVIPIIASNASYYSNEYHITWANWLLTKGTQVVVGDYRVMYGDGKGRSQGGIMIKSTNSSPFRVDPEHAGTTSDNFITRAIIATQPQVLQILRDALT